MMRSLWGRGMRSCLFLSVLLGAVFGLSVAAQASTVSFNFAEASLRGQTANAPDNDGATVVNWIQANCWNAARTAHVDIVNLDFYQGVYTNPSTQTEIKMYAHLTKANGDIWTRLFIAGWYGSTYSDGQVSNNQCTPNI